jgi:SAM-dependent methyltransferase
MPLLQAVELLAELVSLRSLEVLAELGVTPGADAGSLAEAAGVPAERRPAFAWLLRFLATRGLAELDGAGALVALSPPRYDAEALGVVRAALEDTVGPAVDLVERAAAHYPGFLRGELLGSQVLFGAEAMPLWEAYFSNANGLNRAVNRLTAFAARGAHAGDGLRVLEVGGGCGSSGEAVLEALGDRVASYTYSDVAPTLLVRGRRHLQARFPEATLAFQRIDLNKPLADQRVEPASFDLIVGVNTLHVADDLVRALADLRAALAPGGALVLGETMRPTQSEPLAFEFVFQLTEAFQQLVQVPGLREEPGFLAGESWPPLLEQAGFADVRTYPVDLAAAIAACRPASLCALVAR